MIDDDILDPKVISLRVNEIHRKFPALSQVEAYWQGVRRGDSIPARGDLDPRGMENVLEHTCILERIAPGVARFRIAGAHLNDLMGMDVRGMPTTSLFFPEARSEIGRIVENVCRRPEIAKISLKSTGGFGRSPLEAAFLLLPLKDEFGEVTRLLGCLQSIGTTGRQPRRFKIVDVQETKIGEQTVLPVRAEIRRFVTARAVEMATGLAEPAKPYEPQSPVERSKTKRPDNTRPALRLVSDNT